MVTKELTKFDIAEYLEDDAMIAEYLNTVLEDGETEDIIAALGHVAKALSHGSKPQFDTILKVLRAVGGNLNISNV